MIASARVHDTNNTGCVATPIIYLILSKLHVCNGVF